MVWLVYEKSAIFAAESQAQSSNLYIIINMKKSTYICVIGLSMLFCTGCGNKAAETGAMAVDSDSVGGTVLTEEAPVPEIKYDSVTYEVSDEWLEYNVKLVYPKEGPEDVVKNMRKAILANFGLKQSTGEEDFKQVLVKDKKKHSAEAKSEIAELMEDMDDEYRTNHPKYGYSDEITLEYAAPGYATFYSVGDDYRAGAHGMPWQYRFTIDLKTGNQLKWADIILPSAKGKLKPLLKRTLLEQYFENNEDYIDHFDIPGAEPALVENGVWFGYGAYEIAAYAAGMPECVIPYDKMNDFLTEEVKAIIKK